MWVHTDPKIWSSETQVQFRLLTVVRESTGDDYAKKIQKTILKKNN